MAFERVLDYGGASLVRDNVDARVTQEVRTGNYTYAGSSTGKRGIIDSQTDVGGWPAYASKPAPADSDSDGIPDGWLDKNYPGKKATDKNEDGYTYLEVYLNSLVEHITEAQLRFEDGSGLFGDTVPADEIIHYYNASDETLNIRSEKIVVETNIYTISGQRVMSLSPNKSEEIVGLSNLPKGAYIIQSFSEVNDTPAMTKIIK